MHVRRLLPALALVCAPGISGAEDLVFGIRSTAEFDDNVLNIREDSGGDQEEEMLYRIEPYVTLKRERSDLEYELFYQPSMELHARFSGLNEVSHRQKGSFTYRLSATTELFGSEAFRRVPTLDKQTDRDGPTEAAEIIFGRERRRSYEGAFGVRHSFSERFRGELSGAYDRQRYSQEGRIGNDSYAARASVAFIASPRTQYSILAEYRNLEFQDLGSNKGDEVDYYSLFGQWTHSFDPTMDISVKAGPTYSDLSAQDQNEGFAFVSDDAVLGGFFVGAPLIPAGAGLGNLVNTASCPTIGGTPYLGDGCRRIPGTLSLNSDPTSLTPAAGLVQPVDSDSDVTAFGEISFTKRWTLVELNLLASRQEGTAAGTGVTTTVDTVRATTTWKPAELWRVRFLAEWQRRESPFTQTFSAPLLAASGLVLNGVGVAALTGTFATIEEDRSIDTDTYRFLTRVDREITKRFRVFGSATYRMSEPSRRNVSDLEKFRAVVGFRYELDPIQL